MRSSTLRLLGFTLVFCLGVGLDQPASARVACQTLNKQQVAALFDRWNQALQTRQTDKVVALYAPDATLLPTVQNGPLVGRDKIAPYFDHFLALAPVAKIETRVIETGCNVAWDIGLYAFTENGDQPGSHKQIEARYTFIYAPVHGHWLIVHHHSSAQPVATH
ncbi:MAG TPA: SgcJ/EcaC family oxidoreductase [Rhodopila sp.]|uniref:SgcJ/EcaC family oxidoreductase n=1 Tax=Rhodopila sp. TaxID=2480087 RepID=UPI002BE3C88E|nr:SgcJ/EcaC family oxidoreductase [Rhodopila sp.]HVY16759.1 SgcJ/EcaC family oxidoreductase [Rhodopila sp.]